MEITTIGLDTAKSVFHLVGLTAHAKIVLKKRLRRNQLLHFFAKLPVATIGIEACAGAHFWARELTALGHTVRIIPAQDVAALRRGQKNDSHDALAIAEALSRPGQRFIAPKNPAQQDAQALHRLRQGIIRERTALSNRLRGLLSEYGIVFPKGLGVLRRQLLLLQEDPRLSPLMHTLLAEMQCHLKGLDSQLERLTQRIKQQVKDHEQAQRLLAVPGFGPIVASVWCTRIGDGRQFRRGRDVSAALGLVPAQHTTGGKPILLGITKRGDAYLRCLIIHGARAALARAHKKSDPLSLWVTQLARRRGKHKATVALANKIARIAWAMSRHHVAYQPT